MFKRDESLDSTTALFAALVGLFSIGIILCFSLIGSVHKKTRIIKTSKHRILMYDQSNNSWYNYSYKGAIDFDVDISDLPRGGSWVKTNAPEEDETEIESAEETESFDTEGEPDGSSTSESSSSSDSGSSDGGSDGGGGGDGGGGD